MIDRSQWKALLNHPLVEWAVFIVGVILILLSPVVGALPGPGGIFVFALGLAMVLRTSLWARRRYVAFKKWQPKAGRWTDWGMRRKSALRREKLAKERKELDGPPDPAGAEEEPIESAIPAPPAKRPEELIKSWGHDKPGN